MFGKRKQNNLYCIEMSHSEEWLIFLHKVKVIATGQTGGYYSQNIVLF